MRHDPFRVLELSPECTAVEVERQGARLLGLLEVEAEGAARWTGADGRTHSRTADDVREAVAELRDPERRVVAEAWARWGAVAEPESAGGAPRWDGALGRLGYGRD